MMREFFPEIMDEKEVKIIASLIESLKYLKCEAEREGQDFIAYAIEDAILQAKGVRDSKYVPQSCHNMQ